MIMLKLSTASKVNTSIIQDRRFRAIKRKDRKRNNKSKS